MASATADRFGVVAEARGLTIVVEAAPGDHVVAIPPDWLDRLLGVLVDNACKFAPDGSTVRVAVGGEAGRVEPGRRGRRPGHPRRRSASGSSTASTAPPTRAREPASGLAIADGIVRATHGRWRVGTSSLGGASMAVSWPRVLGERERRARPAPRNGFERVAGRDCRHGHEATRTPRSRGPGPGDPAPPPAHHRRRPRRGPRRRRLRGPRGGLRQRDRPTATTTTSGAGTTTSGTTSTTPTLGSGVAPQAVTGPGQVDDGRFVMAVVARRRPDPRVRASRLHPAPGRFVRGDRRRQHRRVRRRCTPASGWCWTRRPPMRWHCRHGHRQHGGEPPADVRRPRPGRGPSRPGRRARGPGRRPRDHHRRGRASSAPAPGRRAGRGAGRARGGERGRHRLPLPPSSPLDRRPAPRAGRPSTREPSHEQHRPPLASPDRRRRLRRRAPRRPRRDRRPRRRVGAARPRRRGPARGDPLPRQPDGQRLREHVLRHGRPGGVAELVGLVLRVAGRLELHHARQAAPRHDGDGALRPPLRPRRRGASCCPRR